MNIDKKEIGWLKRDKRHRSAAALRQDIARLKAGEPLAYVINYVNFLGCKIDLSERPLIPRPETEYWTEKAIAVMNVRSSRLDVGSKAKANAEPRTPNLQRSKRLRVLDLFAGSGCIGVAVLKHVPGAEVWFADSEPACLKQIRRNLKLNPVRPARYKIRHSNILQNVGMSFDYVLANPPYIPAGRKNRLAKSVLNYEPHSALFAGRDGLRFVRPLIKEARTRLRPGGELWLEFDSSQKTAVLRLAKEGGYSEATIHKDQFGRFRYARLLQSRPAQPDKK